MEIEEPIQQLLKNTGWSYEDLLSKLQQYKSVKENSKEKQPEKTTKETEEKQTHFTDECIVDSTEEINESDIPKVQNLDASSSIVNRKCDTSTSSHPIAEDFSDTDEDEVEVNATNCNIINEIIDDISSAENSNGTAYKTNLVTSQPTSDKEDTTEVTEVRVIEVNSDNENTDNFDDDFPYKVSNATKKIEYLETYPRRTLNKFNRSDQHSAEDIVTIIEENNGNRRTLNKFNQSDQHNAEDIVTIIEENNGNRRTLNKFNQSDRHNAEDIVTIIEEDNSNRRTLNKFNQSDQHNAEDIVTIIEENNGRSNSESKPEYPLNFSEKLSKNSHQIECSPIASCSSKSCSSEKSMLQTLSKVGQGNFENDVDKFSPENVEDLRNNLKMQLNCLRTRKKGHFFQDLKSKVTDNTKQKENIVISNDNSNNSSTSFPCNTSKILNSTKGNEAEDISKSDNTAEDNSSDSLYTQTNEFGLVILNVQGGIEMDTLETSCSNTTAPGNNFNEDSSNANDSVLETATAFSDSNTKLSEDNSDREDIDPKGVFDEIRKIIRKQRDPTNKTRKYGVSEARSEETMDSSDCMNSLHSQRVEDKHNSFESASFSAENSLSSCVADDNDHVTDKNSPFVSNTLDEFLTENSKLNISYKVPKSGAEDGLTDSYHVESPLILKKVVKVDETTKPKATKVETIKAKTVAQKRKILERQRLKEFRKASHEKNKIKTDSKNSTEQKTDNSKENIISDEIKGKRNSFVMYNNKMIWVRSTLHKCIGKIVTKTSPIKWEPSPNSIKKQIPIENSQKQRKFSLLNEMGKQYKQQVKYRPGPLSKKPNLQISGQDNWITEKKVLPKIFVEIIPKIGQPIPSNVLSKLPQNDGRLTENWVEFALSVLKTNNPNDKHKTFKFPLAYSNNQEYILVRKQKTQPQLFSAKKTITEKKTTDVIADIIDDLIKYVEIKEIAPTLIKEEEKMEYEDDTVLQSDIKTKMPAISENVSSIFKKPQKKRSRIELELSRLSCKVVNVEVEESFNEELCNKSHCRLGCICKSLKCDRNLNYHCQKVECMLNCTCPKEKQVVYDKLTLPAGTDILSTDAVNRIEDEAKKDLAKVEREFTQTVIHTSDKTIVVGLGGRYKTRRATKAPKKYSDYIESFDSVKVEQKVKEASTNDFFKNCVVSLEKLHLPGIIPFCLIHTSYECGCEGISSRKSSTTPVKTKEISVASRTVKEKTEVPEKKKQHVNKSIDKEKSQKPVKRKRLESKDNDDNEESFDSDSFNSSTDKDVVAEPTLMIGRPMRNIKKTKHEDFSYSDEVSFFNYSDCARIRGIPSHIQERRVRSYSPKAKALLQKDDFINNITDANILKATLPENQQLLEADLLKNQLIVDAQRNLLLQSLNSDNSNSEKNMHKRKQTIEVRYDENNVKQNFNQDLAIQRRKKIGLPTRINTNIEPVFDGEIIIDGRNMELLKKMGPRTVAEGYARLLPWKALIESFKNGSIKIWCMIDQPSRLLINKCNQQPPKNYVDIRQTNQTSEVVLWILRSQLPPGYHEDNVSFILKQTKYNYEICGLCTKNFTDNSNSINRTVRNSEEKQRTEQVLTPFKHRDLNGEQQMLYIQKSSFKLQELIEENLADFGEMSVERSKLYMWAALPEIYRACKWRMVFLNSDFTFLYFTKLKYSIKYTDLVIVNNMAKVDNFTVLLKNSMIQAAYYHPEFGIYFDSHYQDRLFIGPYNKQFNEDDIQTLRYINKSLVCTESFNKMQGKTDYKCGHWLIERPYIPRRRTDLEPTESTIDLTSDDDSSVVEKKRKSDPDTNEVFKRPKYTGKLYGKEDAVILHKNIKIKVIDSMPRKPEDFNRYIITNIPHFGYLGAYQHCNSKELDVSWPFENKLLRFPSVNSATDFLQERFSSLLQPIPETFKINVIVLTFMDLKNSHPINASILTGHYICGEFGCCNVKTVTNDFCMEKLGMKREELLRIFAKRAQAFIRAKIEELAGLLYIPKSQMGCYDIVSILDMARKEVLEQRDLEKNNVSAKNDLLLQKRELALKVFNMISVLPEEQRHVENLKFREILRNRTVLQVKTPILEPIEIPDSSDEEENKADDDKDMPTLCDQSVPEPPRSSHLGMPTLSEQVLPNQTKNSIKEKCIKEPSTPGQPESTLAQNEVSLISILKEKSIPNKVAETTNVFPRQRQLKLKSILKSNLPSTSLLPGANPLGTTSKEPIPTSLKSDVGKSLLKNMPPPQFLPGVKIVKTSTGKLVLVSDKSPKKQITSKAVGTKVIIKNNKILSIKSLDTNKKGTQPISVLEQGPINSISPECGNANKNIEISTIKKVTNPSGGNIEISTIKKVTNPSGGNVVVKCFSLPNDTLANNKSLTGNLSNNNNINKNVDKPVTDAAVSVSDEKNSCKTIETKEDTRQNCDAVSEPNPEAKPPKVDIKNDNTLVNQAQYGVSGYDGNSGSSHEIEEKDDDDIKTKKNSIICVDPGISPNTKSESDGTDLDNESCSKTNADNDEIDPKTGYDKKEENVNESKLSEEYNSPVYEETNLNSTKIDEHNLGTDIEKFSHNNEDYILKNTEQKIEESNEDDTSRINSNDDGNETSNIINEECSNPVNEETSLNKLIKHNNMVAKENLEMEILNRNNEGYIQETAEEKTEDAKSVDIDSKENSSSIHGTKNLKIDEADISSINSNDDGNGMSKIINEEYSNPINEETSLNKLIKNDDTVVKENSEMEILNHNNEGCIQETTEEKTEDAKHDIDSKVNGSSIHGTENLESNEADTSRINSNDDGNEMSKIINECSNPVNEETNLNKLIKHDDMAKENSTTISVGQSRHCTEKAESDEIDIKAGISRHEDNANRSKPNEEYGDPVYEETILNSTKIDEHNVVTEMEILNPNNEGYILENTKGKIEDAKHVDIDSKENSSSIHCTKILESYEYISSGTNSHDDNEICKQINQECSSSGNEGKIIDNTKIDACNLITEMEELNNIILSSILDDMSEKTEDVNRDNTDSKQNPTICITQTETNSNEVNQHDDGSSCKRNEECNEHEVSSKTGQSNHSNESHILQNITDKSEDVEDKDIKSKENVIISDDQIMNIEGDNAPADETDPIGVSSRDNENYISSKTIENCSIPVKDESDLNNTDFNKDDITNKSIVMDNKTKEMNYRDEDIPKICIGQTESSENNVLLDKTDLNCAVNCRDDKKSCELENSVMEGQTNTVNTDINVQDVITNIEKFYHNIGSDISENVTKNVKNENEDIMPRNSSTTCVSQTEKSQNDSDDEVIRFPNNNEVERVNSDNDRTIHDFKSSDSKIADESNVNCPNNQTVITDNKSSNFILSDEHDDNDSCSDNQTIGIEQNSNYAENKTDNLDNFSEDSTDESSIASNIPDNVNQIVKDNESTVSVIIPIEQNTEKKVDNSDNLSKESTDYSSDSWSIPDSVNQIVKDLESTNTVINTTFSNNYVVKDNEIPLQPAAVFNENRRIFNLAEASEDHNLPKNNIPESVAEVSEKNDEDNHSCDNYREIRSDTNSCRDIENTGDCVTMDKTSDESNTNSDSTDTNKQPITGNSANSGSNSSSRMNVYSHETEYATCEYSSNNISTEEENPVNCSEQIEDIIKLLVDS